MPTSPLKTNYRDDLSLFRDRWEYLGLSLAIITILAFPFLANDHWLSLGVDVWIMIVGAVSMMVLTGFAGQVSLGHAAFLAIGAYATAICSLSFGLPFWLALPIGMVLCTIVGIVTGPFALRLEGLYLAIVTIGLLFLVQHLLRNGLEIHYGKDYLHVPFNLLFAEPNADPLGDLRYPYEVGPITLSPAQILYFVVAPISLVAIWLCGNFQRSNPGRVVMAVRDGELAAGALGVDAARTKILAFGISSAFAGLAGGLLRDARLRGAARAGERPLLQRFQFLAERVEERRDLPVDLLSVNGVEAGQAFAAQQFRGAHGDQPRGRRARTATTVWLARSDASASVEAS